MAGYAAIAGLVLGGIGSAIQGNSDKKKKQGAQGMIYGWDPLDTTAITDEALLGMSKNFGSASALGTQFNDYYSGELKKLLETAYPGYASQLGKYADTTSSMMRGEIPMDVSNQVFRSGAGKALMGGYSGGGLHSNLVARDLGTTSYGIQQQGMNRFAAVPGTFPRANPVDISQLTGPTPNQLVAIREKESANKLRMLLSTYGMPTMGDAMGSWMQSTGGALMGAGSSGMLSGGGGGMGSMGGPDGSGNSFPNSWSASQISNWYGGR